MATHVRSYDKGEQIEDPVHIEALVAEKRAAHQHRATDRLIHVAPAAKALLVAAAARNDNLGAITAGMLRLLSRYGAQELNAAIEEALAREVPHPHAVRLALERRRHARGEPPPLAVVLPEHVTRRDVAVTPQPLDAYDQLRNDDEDNGDDDEHNR